MLLESTSEELELAYSPSSVAKDYRATIADYTRRSALCLEDTASRRIRYGEAPEEYAILFEAPSTAKQALLVFFHGGYWQELAADDSCFPAADLLSHDISYAAVNYTLAPDASISAIVEQCAQALKALTAIRPQARIVIAGSSAGAHLAAMLMTLDWRNYGLSAAPFCAAVLISGVYDLRPLVRTSINRPLKLNPDTAMILSPQFLTVHATTCGSIPGRLHAVVCWGEHETPEFKRQSQDYAAALKSAGLTVSSYEVAGTDHFDIVFDLSNTDSPLGQDTFRLLGEKI